MNINKVKENNDHKHQLNPIENDHEHQQNLGEQWPCTPIESKENMAMNITKNER